MVSLVESRQKQYLFPNGKAKAREQRLYSIRHLMDFALSQGQGYVTLLNRGGADRAPHALGDKKARH